jgi:HK97 family phage portal protein
MARRLGDVLLRRRAGGYLTDAGQGLQTIVQGTWPANRAERTEPGQWLSYVSNGYYGNGILFAVIGARMHLFAEAQPRILDTRTGRSGPVDDPRLERLRHPWPNGSTGELLARMEQDNSLAGNFYAAIAGDRLIRLRPDHVDVLLMPGDDGHPEVEAYVFSPSGVVNDDSIVYGVDEIIHYSPVPDPMAHYRGLSWVTPVVREINADIAMTTHKIKFFEHAATPNMLIKYQQKLSPKSLEDLAARFQARHGGAENAWRTAVLDEGADITMVGQDMEKATFAALQAAGENRIAAAAGVPGIVVGLKEGLAAATYSNFEQAMRRFSDGTMRPLWRTAAAALDKLVDLADHEALVLDASSVDALREGEQARAQTFRIKAVTAGELIRSGYDPDTVAEAVALGDLSVLKHTGGVPTALYPDGQVEGAGGGSGKGSPNAQGDQGGDALPAVEGS